MSIRIKSKISARLAQAVGWSRDAKPASLAAVGATPPFFKCEGGETPKYAVTKP